MNKKIAQGISESNISMTIQGIVDDVNQCKYYDWDDTLYDEYFNVSPVGYMKLFFDNGGSEQLLNQIISTSTTTDALNIKATLSDYKMLF